MRRSFLNLLLPALTAILMSQTQAHATELDDALTAAFDNGELPGLHGTIIDFGEDRLAEVYFPGEDERWGEPLGLREHGPDTLHDLRSVTKAVVGLLYGIALGEGKVPDPQTPLYARFPQYPDLAADPDRRKILVSHALSMQMGLAWNEDLPYSDPRNSEIAMERAEDRYRFALEQPIIAPPGQAWIYSGGAVALIAKLIEDGTGMPLDAYAKEVLFDPLGITNFEWVKGADGVPSAASGLRLTLRDLTRIGHVIGRNGTVDGREIVPADWFEQALTPRVSVDQNSSYGYLAYLIGAPDNIVVIAIGNGGQRLTVQPKHDFVTASFAGRYNDPDSWHTSFAVVIDFAVPAARKRLGR